MSERIIRLFPARYVGVNPMFKGQVGVMRTITDGVVCQVILPYVQGMDAGWQTFDVDTWEKIKNE